MGEFVESSPLLINNPNVPDDVFGEVICHLILSIEPEGKVPSKFGVLVLFIISPSDNVSKINALDAFESEIKDEVAGVKEPLTTLVTNNVFPPF